MRTIIILALILLGLTMNAQDIIVKKNAEEIKAKILEVKQTEIKYKSFENLDGPIYSLDKSDVFFIKYQNGQKDIFSEENEEVINNPIKGKLGMGYYLDDKKISKKEWISILKTNERAYNQWKGAKKMIFPAIFISLSVGVLAGIIVGGSDLKILGTTLIGTGVAFMIWSPIISSMQKKAVKIYNSKKGVSYSFKIGSEGVGFAMTF